MSFVVMVLGSGTFSPGWRLIGFPIPPVAGNGFIPKVCPGFSDFGAREGSSLTVDEIVLLVKVSGDGTFSPGARSTGLPIPEVAGIGLTLNSDASLAGVSGNWPGRFGDPCVSARDFSDSSGTLLARSAVVDWGVTPDNMVLVVELEVFTDGSSSLGSSTLLILFELSVSWGAV